MHRTVPIMSTTSSSDTKSKATVWALTNTDASWRWAQGSRERTRVTGDARACGHAEILTLN